MYTITAINTNAIHFHMHLVSMLIYYVTLHTSWFTSVSTPPVYMCVCGEHIPR